MSFATFVPRLARPTLSWCTRALYFRAIMVIMLVVIALVYSVLVARDTHSAFAIQSKPPTDWSFYINTTSTSRAYTLGCNQGHFDASFSPPVNSEVVLDFGAQNSSGTGTILIGNAAYPTNAQVEAIAEQFSAGYWVCTGSDLTSVLTLGIGTNNSGSANNWYSNGVTWGNVVAAVRASNHSNGYDYQVSVGGANDLESWTTATSYARHEDAINWVNGYASVSNSAFYLDYGDAQGCPTNSSSNGSCNSGWNQYDYWYVSWGAPPAYPTPEIYYSANAQQWAMISLYGAQYQGGRVYMQGPWDEYDLDTSTNTATQAWNQLWTDLNNNSATAQNMIYSLEIHNE